MKKAVFFILIVLLTVPSAFGQFRLDAGVKIPVLMGNNLSNLGGSEDTTYNILEKFTLIFPEVSGTYQLEAGPLKAGAGLQMYTFIFESVVWPSVFAELDLSPVVISAKAGGFGFLFFGVYNHFGTGSIVIPELDAWFKINNSFRVGGGAMLFTSPDLTFSQYPYILYLGGSFTTTF